jgi:high affinity Mn2+ porin
MTPHVLGGVALVVLAAIVPDGAAEVPLKAPVVSPLDWTGAYVGGHFGYGLGGFGPGTNPILAQAVVFPSTLTGVVGGFQAGYNFQLPDKIVLGLETDLSFTSPINRGATRLAPFNTTFNFFGTARSRVGYALGPLLPYVTGGLACNVLSSRSATHVGWTTGTGIEFPVVGHWTGKFEYDYIDLGPRTYVLDGAVPSLLNVDPKIHVFKLGLNYRLSDMESPGSSATPGVKGISESDGWSIHGQTTLIEQGYGRFRSPYQGANSLLGGGEGRETWTATAFIGRRLWEGGEFYFNPELGQGFGLANNLGLAGFSNGEAQKGGSEFPKIRAQRYFIRQTFGLGGEQETVEDGPNQLAGKRDIDRVTITVGRIAIGDIFDNNAYAHDPRADFQNWAMWSSVAYDFPADLPGFTRGVIAELNRKDWALRVGYFEVPPGQNGDTLVFKTGGAIVELEERYTILDQPGKLRFGAFVNRGHTGNYAEATALVAANPALNINAAMASTRQDRNKYGFYVNAEQAISKDVGVFARASWNDGNNEILSFTDIDRSLSGGVSVKGGAWGRPDDTFGLGAAINGLSASHRDFLAAGGLGLLIGDGQLNYSPEKIMEAYYAYNLAKWLTLSFDYQFIVNPAFNADRGPVSLYATRLHAEF